MLGISVAKAVANAGVMNPAVAIWPNAASIPDARNAAINNPDENEVSNGTLPVYSQREKHLQLHYGLGRETWTPKKIAQEKEEIWQLACAAKARSKRSQTLNLRNAPDCLESSTTREWLLS
jgi:predicted ribonuclease toxin of YeeF-YezG toxin-antitoxin module